MEFISQNHQHKKSFKLVVPIKNIKNKRIKYTYTPKTTTKQQPSTVVDGLHPFHLKKKERTNAQMAHIQHTQNTTSCFL